MDKNKYVKKTLLRNPELPLPKAKPPQNAANSSQNPENARFNVPEMHSTLKISEKMDRLAQPRKVKSLSAPTKELAVDEKVSRKVNFPYCKSVFKDLIPLTNLEAKTQQSVAFKTHSFLRDLEPDLRDFLEIVERKEYFCTPKSGLRIQEEEETFGSDGLELYRFLQV